MECNELNVLLYLKMKIQKQAKQLTKFKVVKILNIGKLVMGPVSKQLFWSRTTGIGY